MLPQILVIVFTFTTAPVMTVKTIPFPGQDTCEAQGEFLARQANTLTRPNDGQCMGTAVYACQDFNKGEMTPLWAP